VSNEPFDVEAWREAPTDEVYLVEALLNLVYAWESRRVDHPDHPVNVRAWSTRMEKASKDARAFLERMGVEDERLVQRPR
jgi:hypothetical protein